MSETFAYFDRLDALSDIPADSILSRTILDTPALKWVLFHFAAGQELSEHTAAMPAVIQIVSGEARLTLGETVHEATPGTAVYMPAHLRHAVHAHTPLVMLLQLIKPTRPAEMETETGKNQG
jgi:quercetin dioxygenase-like cupin family protein